MPLQRSVPRTSRGIKLACGVGPEIEALIADALVELKVRALERGDERLQCAVGVGAGPRGHLVGYIRREQPGTPDEELELAPLLAHLLQPPEQAQECTSTGWHRCGAE